MGGIDLSLTLWAWNRFVPHRVGIQCLSRCENTVTNARVSLAPFMRAPVMRGAVAGLSMRAPVMRGRFLRPHSRADNIAEADAIHLRLTYAPPSFLAPFLRPASSVHPRRPHPRPGHSTPSAVRIPFQAGLLPVDHLSQALSL